MKLGFATTIVVATSLFVTALPNTTMAASERPLMLTLTCAGSLKKHPPESPYMILSYEIGKCWFNTKEIAEKDEKQIVEVCDNESVCEVKAYGICETPRIVESPIPKGTCPFTFNIERVVTVRKVSAGKVADTIPKQFQGQWYGFHGTVERLIITQDEEVTLPGNANSPRTTCTPSSIRHANDPNKGAIAVTLTCGPDSYSELWAIVKVNGTDVLIVANYEEVMQTISGYTRQRK